MSASADRRGAPGRRALSLLLAGLVVMACCLLVLWAREQAHQPSAWSGVYATEDARIALLVRPDGRVTVVLPEGSEQGVEAVEDAEALRVGGLFPGRLSGPGPDARYRYEPDDHAIAPLRLVRID